MEDIRLKYLSPVVTGTPGAIHRTVQPSAGDTQSKVSFQDVLQQQLSQTSNVSFSKHAVKRAVEHGIDLSDDSIARLNEGVRLANEKHLDDTLILVDKTAFVVNVKNNTVITTVAGSELKGNIFTNIHGTVIV